MNIKGWETEIWGGENLQGKGIERELKKTPASHPVRNRFPLCVSGNGNKNWGRHLWALYPRREK